MDNQTQLLNWMRMAAKYIPTTTQCQCQGEHDCEPCQLRKQAYEFIVKERWQEAVQNRDRPGRQEGSTDPHGGNSS